MRGFIQIPVLIAIVFSAAFFGGGGYYIAQKSHKPSQPAVNNVPMDLLATTTVMASTTETSETDSSSQPATKASTQTTSVKTSLPTTTSTVVIDVCVNIEGNQTAAPAGYSVASNMCTKIDVKDLCPNISGVQEKVPSNMSYVVNYDECLTEEQLENKVNTEFATQAQTDDLIARKKKIQAQIDMYNRFLDEIKYDFYACKADGGGNCIDPIMPKNPIPAELQAVKDTAPASVYGGGTTTLIPKSSNITNYVKEKIHFILLDLQAEYKQL